jgi:hypothetical protein
MIMRIPDKTTKVKENNKKEKSIDDNKKGNIELK